MEAMDNRHRNTGTNLFSDPSLRMRIPPGGKKLAAFENFGSDFGRPDKSKKERRNYPFGEPPSDRPILEWNEDTRDELDIISALDSPDEEVDKDKDKDKRKGKGKAKDNGILEPERQGLYSVPNLSKMKFKKNKDSNSAMPSGSQQSSSGRPDSRSIKATSKRTLSSARGDAGSKSATAASTYCTRDGVPKPTKGPLRDHSPNGRHTPPPRPKPRKRQAKPVQDDTERDETAIEVDVQSQDQTRKTRPKPRPVHKSRAQTNKKPEVFPNLSPPSGEKERDKSLPNSENAPAPDHSKGNGKGKGRGKGKTTSTFPALSPLANKTLTSSQVEPSPFPDLSPLGNRTPKSSQPPSTFPTLSPLTSVPSSSQSKSEIGPEAKPTGTLLANTLSSSSDSEERSSSDELGLRRLKRRAKGGAAPFPLSTQVLESIGHSERETGREMRGKRTSDEGEVLPRKKMKEATHEILALDNMDEDAEFGDDSMFLDPSVDPATLCPWCDEPLPDSPSPHLNSLIAASRRRSYPDARPSNPLGLKAPFTTYIQVCQRHRFERDLIPRARRKGWPLSIDFARVRRRVEGMKSVLRCVIEDRGDWARKGWEKVDLDDSEWAEDENRLGARGECVFWREVVRQYKKEGSRKAAGVIGQFTSFEKTQPGYYGELGSVVIQQTLYNLFPPSTFDPEVIAPLTPTEFIQRILLPEAAMGLIREDMRSTKAEAVVTLRESAQYGVAMYPGDEEKSAGAGVVEDIVRERAMVRRRELEEEEEREEREERSKSRKENKCEANVAKGKGKAVAARKKAGPETKEGTKQSSRKGAGERVGEGPQASQASQRKSTRTAWTERRPAAASRSSSVDHSHPKASDSDRSSTFSAQVTALEPGRNTRKASIELTSDSDEVEITTPRAVHKSRGPSGHPARIPKDEDTPRPMREEPVKRSGTSMRAKAPSVRSSQSSYRPLQAAGARKETSAP